MQSPKQRSAWSKGRQLGALRMAITSLRTAADHPAFTRQHQLQILNLIGEIERLEHHAREES